MAQAHSGLFGGARGAAIMRLEDFAAIQVSGEDRRDFLQGQLTQHMRKVTSVQAAPAAWCNRQGRVLCLMAAVEWNDATYLVLPTEMSKTCIRGLGRYILRAKARIEPSRIAVFGCVNADALFLPRGRSKPARAEQATPTLQAVAWQCSADSDYCAVRLPGEGNRALLLGAPPDGVDSGTESGWTAERWRLADIEAEIPWIGCAASGKFLAHSLNLDRSGAVSFTKGCYVGQEIIARMEHRGRPKRRMRRVRLPLEAVAQPGAKFQHPDLGAITIIRSASDGEHMSALAEVRLAQNRTGG